MAQVQIIFDGTSDRFDDWKANFIADREYDGLEILNETDEDWWESFNTDNRVWAEEVKDWLNVQIDGVIMAYADLGLWNGRVIGARKMGRKLNDIIDSFDCDSGKFYADRYDVKGTLYHHDGTNYVTFRFVPDNKKQDIETIMSLARRGKLTWDYFRKHTKSIKQMVANAMGWKK